MANPAPYPGGAYTPSIPPMPYPSSTPATRRITSGLPPSLGLAVMLLSVPAMLTFVYGLTALFAGLLFSSIDTGSSDLDFSDAGNGLGAIGVFLLILGLIGVVSVVAMAAGSTAGRLSCTVFVGLILVLTFIVGLAGASEGGVGSLLSMVIGMAPGFYILWAMWSGRSSEVF